MAETKQANRTGLEPHEIAELDSIEREYEQARKDAYATCNAAIVEASRRRAERLFKVIDEGPRSTRARVANYLGVRPNTLTDLRRRWAARNVPQAA